MISQRLPNPDDTTTDTTKPEGIGNVVAKAVLDYRHRDGANQLGDEPGGTPGGRYSDYTSTAIPPRTSGTACRSSGTGSRSAS